MACRSEDETEEMFLRKAPAGVILLSAMLLSSHAFAHAHLVAAVPAAGSVVAVPPQSVKLSFSEPLEARFSSVAVTNRAGVRVDGHDLAAAPGDPKTVQASLAALTPGPYTVTWRAVSVDTHRTQGSFTFSVRP